MTNDLPKLPVEVKTLVNDGVYSLYSVKDLSGVAFVLMTNAREFYALSPKGEVLSNIRIKSLESANVVEAVHFDGLSQPQLNALRLNYA